MNITKDAKSIARLEHMNTTKIQNKGSLLIYEIFKFFNSLQLPLT